MKDPTGLTRQLGTPAVATVAKNGYGQGQENDADANAIRLMVAAGYDPNGLPQFLQKLQSAGGGAFSTHPGKAERITKTQAIIVQLGNPQGKTLKDRFDKNAHAEMRRSMPEAQQPVAVITGAGRGIGRATAIELGRAGYRVVLAGRDPETLEETERMLGRDHAAARVVQADVTKPDDVERLIAVAHDDFGRVDALVNNAGHARSGRSAR